MKYHLSQHLTLTMIIIALSSLRSLLAARYIPLVSSGNIIWDLYGDDTSAIDFDILMKQWKVVGSNPSVTSNQTTCNWFGPFFGGPGVMTSSGYFKRTYEDLIPHNTLSVSFIFIACGGWQTGDYFYFDIGGVSSSIWCLSSLIASHSYGFNCQSITSLTTSVTGNMVHTAETATVTIHVKMQGGGIPAASFGIRDVVLIQIYDQPTNTAGFSISLPGSGLPNVTPCDAGSYMSTTGGCIPCSSCNLCSGAIVTNCFKPPWANYYTTSGYSPCTTGCQKCTRPVTTDCLQCNFPLVLSPDGSCQSTCPTNYAPIGAFAKKCLMVCDTGEYLYWNNTCRSSCNSPLIADNTDYECDYPCNQAYQEYLYPNSSCLSACPYNPRNESGYLFCDIPPLTADKTTKMITVTTAAMKSIIKAISCLVCLGSSINLTAELLSKLIQSIRFLVIQYPARLENVLQTWGTDILNLNIPSKIDRQITTRDIPAIFTQYGLEPSFLSNTWGFIITLISACTIWILCRGLIWWLQSHKKVCTSILYTIAKKMSRSLTNFIVIQIYGSLGDIMFFSVLEIRSVSFDSAWSSVSFALSVVFIVLELSCIGLYLKFLIRYQQIKTTPPVDQSRSMESFIKKYESLEVLYKDFSDASLFKHGFLLVLIARDIVINLVVVTMVSLASIQAVLLICSSVLICVWVIFRNPFRERFEQIAQLFSELCVLIVFACVVMLATFNSDDTYTINLKERLGVGIITVNIILNCGGIVILLTKIIKNVRDAYREHTANKMQRVHIIANSSILNDYSGSQIAHELSNQRDISGTVNRVDCSNQQGLEREHHEESFDHLKYSPNKSKALVPKPIIEVPENNYNLKPQRIKPMLPQGSPSANSLEPEQNIQFINDSSISNENSTSKIGLSKNIDKERILDPNLSNYTTKKRKIGLRTQKIDDPLRPSIGREDVLERVGEEYLKKSNKKN